MKPFLILIAFLITLLGDSLIYTSQTTQAKEIGIAETIQRKNDGKFWIVDRNYKQGKYEKASKVLDELSKSAELNGLELAYIAHYRGNICYAKKDMNCAITNFESVLEYKSSTPATFFFQAVKVLAQLHLIEKNYLRAISYGELYLTYGAGSKSDISRVMAQSYIALENYQKALPFALQGIDGLDTDNKPLSDRLIKRAHVYWLIGIYKELNQLEGAYEFIESMGEVNPKTKYKLQIAELHAKLGMPEKAEAIHQNLIDKGLAGHNQDGKVIIWNSSGRKLPKFRPIPYYPKKALARGQEGWVELMMDIDKLGKTQNIRITDTSRRKTFDKSAINAAEGYLFDPTIKNGEPVIVKDYEIRISFEIHAPKK